MSEISIYSRKEGKNGDVGFVVIVSSNNDVYKGTNKGFTTLKDINKRIKQIDKKDFEEIKEITKQKYLRDNEDNEIRTINKKGGLTTYSAQQAKILENNTTYHINGNEKIRDTLKGKIDPIDIETFIFLNNLGLGRFLTEDIEKEGILDQIYHQAGYTDVEKGTTSGWRKESDRPTKSQEVKFRKLFKEYKDAMINVPRTDPDNDKPIVIETVVAPVVESVGEEEDDEESTPAVNTQTTEEVTSVVNTDTTAIATGNYDNTIQVSDTERILQERIFRIRDDILNEERAIPRSQERIDQLTSLMNDVEAEVLNLEEQGRNLHGAETGQLIDAGYDVSGETGNVTMDEFGNIIPEIENIDPSGGSDPDDLSGGSNDPDTGSNTIINMNEDIVDSPALNNTAILPTSPYKPKYHLDAIKFMYGNADTPNWDPSITLAVQKSDLKKEIINLYIDTLIETYGKKMLIFKRKSDGDLVELNEVMQLQYSIERGMQIGPRARQAVVSVADLVRFDNTLRSDPTVPQPPPSNEITPLNEVNNRLAQTTNAAAASAQRGRNVYESNTYNQRFERIITNPYGIRTDIRLMPVGPAYDAFDI